MILVGCCGWALARARYTRLWPVVELQSTFYQLPSVALAQKWRAGVPENFQFAMKAWQLITHTPSSPTYRRLKVPIDTALAERYGHFRQTDEVWRAWLETQAIAEALAASVVVFQSPPRFTAAPEHRASVEAFFGRIQRGAWLAVWEPRGAWPPELVQQICRSFDLIHCVDPFVAEPCWGRAAYFRLHGRGGYRYRYSDEELAELYRMCRRQLELGRAPVYVMFNNTAMKEDALRFGHLVESSGGKQGPAEAGAPARSR